jgi:DNA repair exonuclease SbcCD nuclease subunit
MRLLGISRIHLVGDLHLGLRNNSIEWLEITKSYLHELLTDDSIDPNGDILILEGDVFHSRESVNIRIQNEAFEIFTLLAKKFKRGVFIILGNHDTYYKDKNEVHSLKSIGNLASNIHVFENPESLTINDKHNFLMLPWVEDIAKLNNVIADHKTLCQYIICHADIKSFNFNKWVKVEHGLDPGSLADYKRVYSGHIHHRQEKDNILYTGAPYQMDRGDIGNTKGHYQLIVDGSEITEVFVKNKKSPTFIKIDMFELLEMPISAITHMFHNNFVDVMIDISFTNKLSIPRFLEELITSSHRRIEFFTYAEKSKTEETVNEEFNPDDGFNITDIFKMYLKSKEYSTEFKRELAKKFIEVHKAVKEEKSYA